MLFVSSTLLLLVNAVTLSRVIKLFNWVAILILLFYGIIWCDSCNIALLDTWEGIYGGLFHSFITHSFALFLCIIGAIVLQLIVYYPQTFFTNSNYGSVQAHLNSKSCYALVKVFTKSWLIVSVILLKCSNWLLNVHISCILLHCNRQCSHSRNPTG
jgi:hypothetical protein